MRLEVRGLTTRFPVPEGTVHAVEGVSFTLPAGGSLALVGESGCGKTVTALSLLGLVPHPGRVVAGAVLLGGKDLAGLSEEEWRAVRGREIAMVFQDPMTCLNPVLTVERQLTEPLRWHLGMGGAEARARAIELLDMVRIPGAASRLRDHPHQLSGGQRQRVMLAMALACRPAVLVADEPTTALDVTVQAQIVALVRELQRELGMSVLWITHDLALAGEVVERVAVMYAGAIVEEATVDELFRNPRHPYTAALLGALPATGAPGTRLAAIEGRPPDLLAVPGAACAFAPRCAWAEPRCREGAPPLQAVARGHEAACWRWEETVGGAGGKGPPATGRGA
jgi:oligopeptide/dipeptide ABC transporter ATP-binding protein